MKVCSFCSNIIHPGDQFWYCCGTKEYKFCKFCRESRTCHKCGKKPSLSERLRVCRICDAEDLILTNPCDCGPMCRACISTNRSCEKCYKAYPSMAQSYIPQRVPDITSPPTSNKKVICSKCQRSEVNCICNSNTVPAPPPARQIYNQSQVIEPKQQIPAMSTVNQPSMARTMPAPRTLPMEECQNCYLRKPETQLYCNMCGHFFCQQCLTKEGSRLVCNTCRQPINQEGLNMFLGISGCILCEKPLPADKTKCFGPDKNVCQNCFEMYGIDINVQSPTIVSSDPPSFNMQINKQPNNGNNNQNGPVQLKPVPIDPVQNVSLLRPDTVPQRRTDMAERTPEKPPKSTGSILTPDVKKSPIYIKNSPAVDRRKMNPLYASMDNQTILECASCTIPFQISTLINIPCKGNSHRMCRYCAIKARTKECLICKRSEDGHLDKYFTYREPTTEDRENHNNRLMQKAMGLCGTCNIIVPSGKLLEQRGKRQCRTCIIKTK